LIRQFANSRTIVIARPIFKAVCFALLQIIIIHSFQLSCTSHFLIFILPLTRSHYFHNNKMPSLRQILPVLAAAASVDAAMGPAFSTGPVGSGSWIRESTSTLVLPKAPSGSSGDASLWVGMGTSNGDLIQSIADNWNSVCVLYL
jgi:hypothetical protein